MLFTEISTMQFNFKAWLIESGLQALYKCNSVQQRENSFKIFLKATTDFHILGIHHGLIITDRIIAMMLTKFTMSQ